MKKLITLIFLMLQCVASLGAPDVKLHFWGNDKTADPGLTYSSDTWTYVCKGSQFDTWGIVNSNQIQFKPWFNWSGKDRWMNQGGTYTYSGQKYTFQSNWSGDPTLTLPADYANKTFTFYLDNYSTSDPYKIDLKISWNEDIKLESSLNSSGAAYDSYDGEVYTWTWTESMLSSATDGDNLYFNLDLNGTNYGPNGADYNKTGSTSWYTCVTGSSYRFYVVYAEGNTYKIKAMRNSSDASKWDIYIETIPIMKLKSTLDNFAGTKYSSLNNGEYVWTWSRSDLSNTSTDERIYFHLYNAGNGKSYGCYDSHEGSIFDMTSFTNWYACQNESACNFYVTHTENNVYTIRAKYEDNQWKVKVEITSPILLKSSIDSWRGTLSESESGGVYTWTWTKDQLSGYAEGAKLEFNLKKGTSTFGSYDHSGANEFDMTNYTTDDGWYGCTNTDYHFYVTYSKGNTYTIQAKYESNVWKIKVITNTVVHDYYWVSPQITNNQKLEYFKMVPSRNRSGEYGDGKTSDKYFSFTIKDSDLKNWDGSTPTTVQWYVVRDDDAYWYRPASSTEMNTSTATSRGDFKYLTFDDCGTSTNRNTYVYFTKGVARSYTFILNAKPSSGSGNLAVDFPDPTQTASTLTSYYLIGNFNSASESEYINISNTAHPMTKIEYADSVVYQCTVSRPAGGWGNLYLDINPANNSNWSNVYRPLISLDNNLDGRALVGGITKVNSEQSLNPEPSDFYSGYTFRFNATTMTYQLQFHTSLYLVGDAVTAKDEDKNTIGGSWDLSSSANMTSHLIPLKATQDSRHFRNKVTFVNGAIADTDNTGKGFRFLVKEHENTAAPYNKNWGEDSNVPRFKSLAESADHFAGTDTQYKNYLKYNTGNTSTTNPAADGTANVVFDLPDGDYYINFYNYGENSYYTIEREDFLRDMNEVVYNGVNRYIVGRGETVTNGKRDYTNAYKFIRPWSDYIAWNKPDDVDVYVVTEFNPSGSKPTTTTAGASITLTKQDLKYIPANTGVILAMKTDKNSLKGGMYYNEVVDKAHNTGYNLAMMQMTPYTDPGATVDTKGELKPLYESTALSRYEESNNEDYANYLFGFYHANHVVSGNHYDDNEFLLGFWQTTGNGTTHPNSAFLQITKDEADALGVGAYYTVSAQGANAPAFMLLFDDVDPTVTGIVDVEDVTPTQQSTNDNWYTLSGVRINAPTTKGIYIHGGKKVIVK